MGIKLRSLAPLDLAIPIAAGEGNCHSSLLGRHWWDSNQQTSLDILLEWEMVALDQANPILIVPLFYSYVQEVTQFGGFVCCTL